MGTDYIYRKETPPLRCFGFIGANGPAYYFEEYYLGRPGNYLYFYVGSVEVLPVIMDLSPKKIYPSTTQTRYKPLVEYNCSDIPISDRKSYIVETVMYSSIPIQDLPFLPGPNTDQLNLINN